MAELGPHVVPVLGGLAADHPAGHGRRARPGQRRGLWLLLRPGRRAARRRDHARRSRSTTGTCRRRWRTPAAGPSGATAERFGEYAEVVAAALGRPGAAVHHAQRAVVQRLPRLRQRRARAGPHRRRPPRSPPCTTSTWPTGSPRRAIRRGRAGGAGRRHAQPGVGAPGDRLGARRRRRPPRRRPAEPRVPRPDAARPATRPTSLADTAGGHRLVVRPATATST